MHLVNEATILTTIYYAFLWTDLIESAEKRYFIAWTLIGLMGIQTFINIAKMGVELVQSIVSLCKQVKAKLKWEKHHEEVKIGAEL